MANDVRFVALQRTLIGRYSLERELGRGGMGTVWLARDVQLDRPVAIKVLHPDVAARPGARDRFLREAQTAARLAHPNIVPIYGVEDLGAFVFMVMALIDGESLGARIRRRGPLPSDEAERVVREIGWALSYAHGRGVMHRDVTLENVLLERGTGRALLVDFGLAGEVETEHRGPVIGTPGYLAPEIIRGEAADARADLYALGVVGYAALTGAPPFAAETPGAVLVKHLVQPPAPLAKRAHGASQRLISAVEACLAKDPDARPANAAALLASLERAPEQFTIAPALREWFTRWSRIRPIYALITPLLAVQTWFLAASYFTSGQLLLLRSALLEVFLTVTVIPAGVQALFELRELERLRAAGLSLDDIRTGLPHWRAEERRHHRDRLEPLPSRVIFDLTVFGGVLLAINLFVTYPLLGVLKYLPVGVANYLEGMFYMSPVIYLWTMIGAGIAIAAPGYRLSPSGRIRHLIDRFWTSGFAAALARYGAKRARKRLAATATLHRPTELVLGLAIDDLWRVIPDDLQADLGDVPTLARTLQSGAAELREIGNQLRASEDELEVAERDRLELTSMRTSIENRHRDAVKALEQLRLQLLRLLATRTRTTELTQQISAARELEAALQSDLSAHSKVSRLLRSRHRRGHVTPSPTPSVA